MRINKTPTIGIYVHIPFCKSKCSYCDFCSIEHADDKLMDEYLQALLLQIDDFLPEGNTYIADTIYIGGGTPSLFGGKRLAKLLGFISKRVQVLQHAEITVELNPESTDKKLLKSLKKAGVNRLSLGIQSADDDMLQTIGRLHSFEQAQQAVALCKKYCTSNISLDLIYGLPGQTLKQWSDSIESIASLEPKHISCYALKLEPGSKMFLQNPKLPDDDTQADMYLYAVSRLAELGYKQYEISNFAKDNMRSRHNSRYWNLAEYMGFGTAAHSYNGGKRYSFTADVSQYIEGVNSGKSVLEDADSFSYTERIGEYIMLSLRTCDGVDEHEFYKRFKVDFAPYAEKLQKYIQSGHATVHSGVYSLTPEGFLVSSTILCDILGEQMESGCF